jgi:amino acid transporter
MVGWGTDDYKALGSASPLPGIQLAQRYWGGAWGILLIMLVSSVIAVSIACANVGTRMWYRMGVDGAFPKWFARVHPERRTPVNAILAQWVLAIATAVGLTAIVWITTPSTADAPMTLATAYQYQYYFDGYMIGYVVLLIYTLGNIAAYMLYRRERPSEFSWIMHGLFPLLSTLGMVTILLFSLNIIGGDPLAFQPDKWTLPPAPFNIAVVFVGVWTLIGIGLVLYMRSTGREDWIAKAAEAASERPATDDEMRQMAGDW